MLQVCLNFYWKLFEWITDRYEKTIPDLLECDHMALKPKPFSEAKTGFFHYDPLSTSSFRKNLSTPEAIHFQKAKLLRFLKIERFIYNYIFTKPTIIETFFSGS